MNNCIENDMARLMDSPGSPLSTPSAHTLPPAVERVIALVDRFAGKYGSVQLEIFRLPTSSTAELQRYLNSLTITLRRQGVIAAYSWQYHPSEAAYYLLLFHVDPTHGSISGVVHRLWHSSPPVTQIDHIHIDSFNYSAIKDRLLRSMLAWGVTFLAAPSPFYRHSYGTSSFV